MTEKILRDFSKENNQEGRDQLAKDIRSRRTERFTAKKDLEIDKEEIDSNLEENQDGLERLHQRFEYLNSGFFKKLVKFLEINRLASEINEQEERLGVAKRDSKKIERNIEEISFKEGLPPRDFIEAKKSIEEFYKEERAKYADTDYSDEDIKNNFEIEKLKELSLEDFILLLRRFGSDMVTHVTRQGIRDHTGMMEHSAGVGQSADGFKEMLKTRDIKYILELRVLGREKEKALAEFFELHKKTKEEAVNDLNDFTDPKNQHFAGRFLDRHGPHFAVKYVADAFYGSESGNEIFVAYPSHVIANNFFHRNSPYEYEQATNYNDVWVYMKENEHMSIDAGIVFIKEDAQVDPKNGSIYEIDEQGLASEDLELQEKVYNIASDEVFENIYSSFGEELGHISTGPNATEEDIKKLEEIKILVKGILEEKGYDDDKLVDIFSNYDFLNRLKIEKEKNNKEDIFSTISFRLQKLGILYKKAKTTISSQDYWEDYFSKNPGSKPSKLVYYKESDPNKGLRNWMGEQGISRRKETESRLTEKEIKNSDYSLQLPEEIKDEMERFRSVAMKVIEDFYS